MVESLLPRVVLEPRSGALATHTVIWLHGLGADGHDFEPIVPELGLPDTLAVRFVFPHAPRIPVSINQGFVMPAWYDIRDLDLRNRADEVGVRESAVAIERLIAAETQRDVPSRNIVLAGFSQGGAIALHVGLRHRQPLAGILALSTYLVCADSLERERQPANQTTPIFWGHGSVDPMVPIARGEDARDRLTALGHAVEWHSYRMQHQVCAEEIADIGRWLRGRLTGGSVAAD